MMYILGFGCSPYASRSFGVIICWKTAMKTAMHVYLSQDFFTIGTEAIFAQEVAVHGHFPTMASSRDAIRST